ncbi:MAG: histone deacetylase family protein, partial [Calditrichaeota bacterium]|nr:histone deacetylase family protein [Calditrichota bacterium]
RILIVDFDAHHGNGTQNFFYEDNEVFFISIHQRDIYPHNGNRDQFGAKRGESYTLNIPLNPGSGLADIKNELSDETLNRLTNWAPEVLLFSAGFDAHEEDTISQLTLKSSDYYELTRVFMNLLPGKTTPIISFLEGGYNLHALSESVYYHLKALRDD